MKLNLPMQLGSPTLLTSASICATPSHGLATWKFGSPTHGHASVPINAFAPVRFPTYADAHAIAFPHTGLLLAAPTGPLVFQPRQVNRVSTQTAGFNPIPQPVEGAGSLALHGSREAQVDQALAKASCPCKITRKKFKPDLPLGGIGRGAFGTVYRAKRAECTDEFAVKMIEGASKMVAAIASEVEILGGLSHPSIVNMVDVIEERAQDWMFIVMEFVQGGDLLERITQQPKLFDECLTRVMFFHICCGLAYAHYQGILHRDIKPENVLLSADGFPKLADFGLSRMVKPGEWCNTLAGTPFYKAPEVMQHQAAIYDFPADVFSSGILLSDMMHPDVCMAGVFQLFSDKDKSRFKKKWQDASRPCFSETLQEIQRRMSDQLPGKRGSMHQTCQELLELARSDPMPHPFWNRQTHLPDGPPQQRCLSPEGAAEIAGRLGYALHCGVNVLLDGSWCPGYVKLISESICPGALTICFQDVDGSHKETMVCPWQFNELLRPNPSAVQLFQISPIPRRNKSEGRNKRAESSRPKTPSSKQVKTDAHVANPGKQCCSIL